MENVMGQIAKLRLEFAEDTHHYSEIFPNHEAVKQYAMWLEEKYIALKHGTQPTTTNKQSTCDGCDNLRGRSCILEETNHCIRRAEDHYKKQEGLC